jgi:5-formyltetrahydrofolate cyclo-ligase
MKTLVWTLALALLFATPAEASRKTDAAACAEVKEKIRTIESRMRAGYTRAQGERYNEKLRELKAKRAKLCR